MAKGRILAIDDEAFFRTLYQDLLGEEGYFVRTASGGKEALALLRSEEFDLVITDMEMPEMDGLATFAAIRRFNPEQEVMVVTGQQEVSLAVEAMKRGVSDYLIKPIRPEEFLLVVNKILFRQSLGQEHKKLLDENIEYHSTLAIYQRCLAFLKIHDLDRLADLALETLMDLLKAEGGALWLTGYGGDIFHLRCRRGLSRVAPEEEHLSPEDAQLRLLTSGSPFLSPGDEELVLPLVFGAESLGVIRLEAPSGRGAFNRRDLKVAALVAEFAGSALHNVLMYRSLERSSLRVATGKAYGMAFFRDHIAVELYKARRYGRNLSILKLSVANYQILKSQFRDRQLDEELGRIVEKVNSLLRDADILAMATPEEYYILLPETDYWGALISQKRIRKALRGQLTLCDLKKSHPIQIHLRATSFPNDGHSFEDLARVASRRIEEIPGSLYHRRHLEALSFWPTLSALLGTPGDYRFPGEALEVSPKLAGFQEEMKSSYFRMPQPRLDEIMRAFCNEVVESSRVRGVIYRGCSDFERLRKSLRFIEGLEKSATTLFLLGGRRRVNWDYQRVVPLYLDDKKFHKVHFLLYLNEDFAYALFARDRGGELVGFHTADFYFVENMIAKLQEEYRLQDHI